MTSFKEMEDHLKNFIIQEQSDAHNARNTNRGKYNNIKLWMDPSKNVIPHLFIRISISEACYSIGDFAKINGGLGYEERFIIKWFNRYGIKEKLADLWSSAEKNKDEE